MFIYLYDTKTIDPETGHRVIKIGITGNVTQREEDFTHWNPLGSMITFGYGNGEYEKELHKRYADMCLEREFFVMNEDTINELIEEIGPHIEQEKIEFRTWRRERAKSIIAQLNHYKEIGIR